MPMPSAMCSSTMFSLIQRTRVSNYPLSIICALLNKFPSTINQRTSIIHHVGPQARNMHRLPGPRSYTDMRHKHRDNIHTHIIKNELHSLHLNPTSQPSAEILIACTAECDTFTAESSDITVDLKAIGMDIQERVGSGEEEYMVGMADGLKDIDKDLEDLKKDVEAVREDMEDLATLIEHHCDDVGSGTSKEDHAVTTQNRKRVRLGDENIVGLNAYFGAFPAPGSPTYFSTWS